MRRSLHRQIARWLLPIVAVGIASALRVGLRDAMSDVPPFLLFFGAVMASAVFGGLGPGIAATILAALAIDFFLFPPYDAFVFPSSRQTIELVIFCAEGVFISLLSNLLRAAVHRAQRSEREARELERRIVEVGDAERRRIGHDLHDGLGQQLLGAAFMAKTLQKKLDSDAPAHAAYAGEIAATIEGALHFTRDLARALSTQTIGRPDLSTALADLAATTEKMFGVTCAFHRDANLTLPAGENSEHLYRLAQEAINNAVKHGHASHIDILWQTRIGRQVLRIRDNGRGFDGAIATEKAAGREPGIGLRVMQHRADMVGGQLEIGPAASGGTIVACEFSA